MYVLEGLENAYFEFRVFTPRPDVLCAIYANFSRSGFVGIMTFPPSLTLLTSPFFRRRCAVALEISKSSINSAMLMNSFSRISEWLMVKRFNGMVSLS